MYSLTLTKDERNAFDFVGYRYAAGDVAKILMRCTDQEWDCEEDITFQIPEHKAWEIHDLADGWPLFSEELKNKLNQFLMGIV